MMKLLNSFGAKPSSELFPPEEPAFTRFPASLQPNYSRQRIVKTAKRVTSASMPRAKPPASRQVAPSNDGYGETHVPVDVLRSALPLRFASMDASERDEFVFQ